LTGEDGYQHCGDEHYEIENAADREPGRATEVDHRNLLASSRICVNVVSSGNNFDKRVVTLDVRGSSRAANTSVALAASTAA
jgi:hypothetical protein